MRNSVQGTHEGERWSSQFSCPFHLLLDENAVHSPSRKCVNYVSYICTLKIRPKRKWAGWPQKACDLSYATARLLVNRGKSERDFITIEEGGIENKRRWQNVTIQNEHGTLQHVFPFIFLPEGIIGSYMSLPANRITTNIWNSSTACSYSNNSNHRILTIIPWVIIVAQAPLWLFAVRVANHKSKLYLAGIEYPISKSPWSWVKYCFILGTVLPCALTHEHIRVGLYLKTHINYNDYHITAPSLEQQI